MVNTVNDFKYFELRNQDDDENKLAAIIRKVSNDYPIPITDKVDIDEYAKRILEDGHVIVCEYGKEIVGFVTFYANNLTGKEGSFSLLGILRKFRRHNIASNLFKLSFDIMKSKGMKTAFSYTHKKNIAAINFHKRMGFRIDGLRVTDQSYNISLIKRL